MKHVKTLNANTLKESMKKGGCGECQTSCQSACKTSGTVGNQACENSSRQCAVVYTSLTKLARQLILYGETRPGEEEADKKPLRSSRIVGGIFVSAWFCLPDGKIKKNGAGRFR